MSFKILSLLIIVTMTAYICLVPISVYATSADAVCQGIDATGTTNGCASNAGSNINNAIRVIINIISIVVGVIAVVFVIIGGAKFITSGGNTEKVSNAKNTILYAVIGLVVVAFAQIIVKFVLSKAKT